MRKHFLLLFLMALLPLAGWAGDIIITPGNMTKTYGTPDENATLKFAVTGLTGSDSKNDLLAHLSIVRLPGEEGETVGSYTYTLEWDGATPGAWTGTYDDIIVQGNATLTINKAVFSTGGFSVAVNGSYTYTGSAITPPANSVVVTNGTFTLPASEYDYVATNNVNAGDAAKVTVTVKGSNFDLTDATKNSKDKTFTIGKKALNGVNFSFAQPSVPYTEGGYTAPVPTVTWNNIPLVEGAGNDYTAEWSTAPVEGKFTASGIYTLTLTAVGTSNYSGNASKTFTIEGVDFPEGSELLVTTPAEGFIYDGTAQKPATTVKINNTTWDTSAENADASVGDKYNITWTNNTNAGQATVTITAKNGTIYVGKQLTKTFEIAKQDISTGTHIATIKDGGVGHAADITAVTYNYKEQKPAIYVEKDGAEFEEEVGTTTKVKQYEIAYTNNINAGTGTVTITGTNNFKGSVSKTFEIQKLDIVGLDFEAYANEEYTGVEITPSTTGKVKFTHTAATATSEAGVYTLLEGADKDYTVAYTANVNQSAAATITYTGRGNYTGTKVVNFTITPKALTIKANDQTVNFGDAIPAYTITYTGLTAADKNTDGTPKASVFSTAPTVTKYTWGTTDWATAPSTSTNAGKYILRPMGAVAANGNYTITVENGTQTILANNIQIAVKTKTITYGDDEPLNWNASGVATYTCTSTPGQKFSDCPFELEVTGLDASVDKDVLFQDNVEFTFTRSTVEGAYRNQGTYGITVSGPAVISGGYNVTTYTAGQMIIAPYAVKVKAVDLADVDYNNGDPEISTTVNTTNINLYHGNTNVTAAMPNIEHGTTQLTVATIADALAWVKDKDADDQDILTMGHPGKRVVTLKAAADIVGYTNYTFTTEDGTITFAGTTTTFAFDGAADQFNNIVTLDNLTLTTGVTVKTGRLAADGRQIQAEKWNAYILPFATSVKEISKMDEIGYAVVNVIDEANSSAGNIKFKIWMGDIPANTPFCMKTLNPLPGNTALNFGNNKTIVAPESASVEVAIGTTGASFVGCYDAYGITSANQNETYCFNGGWYTASNVYTVKPFEAYLKNNSNNARLNITFEEADGSTTSIEAISADGKSIAAEGWYNLNGVKLQGIPTEKGVYIKDGKKVVIK